MGNLIGKSCRKLTTTMFKNLSENKNMIFIKSTVKSLGFLRGMSPVKYNVKNKYSSNSANIMLKPTDHQCLSLC